MPRTKRSKCYLKGCRINQRPIAIQPRPLSPRRIAYQIAVARDGNHTYILILLNEIYIKAKDFITMIKENQEYIKTSTGDEKIPRQNLLHATETFLEQQQESKFMDPRGRPASDARDTSSERIRRPANAFFVYASVMRKKVHSLFPEYSNQEISKLLGALWNTASADIKQKYQKIAEDEKLLHKVLFPSFKYHERKQHNSTGLEQHQDYPAQHTSSLQNESVENCTSCVATASSLSHTQHCTTSSLQNESVENCTSCVATTSSLSHTQHCTTSSLQNESVENCTSCVATASSLSHTQHCTTSSLQNESVENCTSCVATTSSLSHARQCITSSFDSSHCLSPEDPLAIDFGAMDDALVSNVREDFPSIPADIEMTSWQEVVNIIAAACPDFSVTEMSMGETTIPISADPSAATEYPMLDHDSWEYQKDSS